MRKSLLSIFLLWLPAFIHAQEYRAVEVQSVHSGGLYLLVQDGYAMNGEIKDGALQTDTDFDFSKPFSLDDKHVWKLESKDGGFKIIKEKRNEVGNLIINYIRYNNNKLSIDAKTDDNTWTIEYSPTQKGFVVSVPKTKLFLAYNDKHTYKTYKDDSYTSKYIKFYRILQIPESYERDLTSEKENRLGTVCLSRDVKVNGLADITFYSIRGKQKNAEGQDEIVLDKEEGTLLAGHSYIYHTTLDHLSLPYSGDFTDSPIPSNGLIGSLEIDNTYVQTGYYILQDGQLKIVHKGNTIICLPYHAYIDLEEVPELPSRTSQASTLRIKVFAKPKSQD